MIKVLFVCLANISRSTMAEGVFKKKVIDAGLEELFFIQSRATTAFKLSSPPHEETLKILNKLDIELSGKVSEKIIQKDYVYYDFIIGMDHINMKYLQRHSGIYRDKVYLLSDIDPKTKDLDIPDPYYTGNFDEVYQMINELLDKWLTMFKMNKLLHFVDLNQYFINQKPLFLRNLEYSYWDKET
ncbi:MAG: low molecular weight phosphotyrosine protein phosphatase, partial [Acholeplasmataceae bacterium]|nr:low molecular weight phosphotyrosine protein phosphatase [Acholeplasmataceae bacterium]